MSFYVQPHSRTRSDREGMIERGSRRLPSPGSSNDLHRSHSFIVDEHDEDFRVGLRRKSFTGGTPHPILHQLSEEGRVNIPVEHIAEEDDTSHTSTTIYPEFTEALNYARNDNSSSKSAVDKKTSPSRTSNFQPSNQRRQPVEHTQFHSREYDPRNYEDRLPPFNNSFDLKPVLNYETSKHRMVSGHKDDEFETGSSTTRSPADNEIHHDKEVENQDNLMKEKYKLHRFLIIPDGNCLYRAVAQACLLDQNQHSVLRQLAIDHIREHQEEFKELVEGDISAFLSAAQKEGEWAGYPEILALSRVLDVNINITTGGSSGNKKVQVMLHYFKPSEHDNATTSSNRNDTYTQRDSIWLSWLSNGHYDTFTHERIENPAYDEWLNLRQSRLESDAAIANRLHMDDINKVGQLDKNREDFDSIKTSPRSCGEDSSNKESSSIIDNLVGETSGSGLQSYRTDTESTPLPHVYPSSNQRQHSPKTTSHTSEANSNITNFDDDLAMALHNEEFDQLCQYLERNGGFDIA